MSKNDLDGKSVIVTGGGSGTGRQVARALTTRGARVEIWGRQLSKLEETVRSGDAARMVAVDLTSGASVDEQVQRYLASDQQVDMFVHCAGVWLEGTVVATDWDAIASHVDGVVTGSIFAAKAAIMLLNAEGGHFVQIAAAAAKSGFIDTALNTAVKRAQDGLQEGLTRELRGTGIKITTIYPDSISSADDASISDGTASSYEDVASVIVFAITAPASVDVNEIILTARATGRWE